MSGFIVLTVHEEIVTTLERSKNIGHDSHTDQLEGLKLKVDRSLATKSAE